MTRTQLISLIRIGSGVLVALLIIAYAISRSLSYARGPRITIEEPLDGASITASTTVLKGFVERANNITLNGRAISIDEQGHWSETLVIFPGSNIITLEARDRFERSVKTELRLQGIVH